MQIRELYSQYINMYTVHIRNIADSLHEWMDDHIPENIV